MPLVGPPLEASVPFHRILEAGVESKPNDLALVSAVTRWTWLELDSASHNLATNLIALGLRPGDRIASLMPNRASLLIFYFACMKAGLVVVPLNYRYVAPQIDHALEVSGARAIFALGERDADLLASPVARRLPLGRITYEGGADNWPHFERLTMVPAPNVSLTPGEKDDPAFIFFTSGSTGKPKGVTHTVTSTACCFASVATVFEMTPEDIILPGSSLSHIGSFIFAFAALSTGAKVVVARGFDSVEMLPLLRHHHPTLLWMLPTMLLKVLRDHAATHDDFRSLRACRSGSDKVPAEVARAFTDVTGLKVDEGYGMTEVALATLSPPSGLIKVGSVGKACPSYELSVRDDHGNEVKAGEDGRLWMRTPCLMSGYWENPDATAEAVKDGWIDSGDLMRADKNGYLWFRGRKKQIIVHDGSNIFPQEVEEALIEHPAIDNVGVIGVHDLMHGENVRAYVALKPDVAPPPIETLIRFARARVGYRAPEEIEFLDEIPLNPTGKVDRVALKRLAEARHAHDYAE